MILGQLILALALALAAPPTGFRISDRTYAGVRLTWLMDRIAEVETGNDPGSVGKLGERTRYQIMHRTVDDYNRRHGTKVTMQMLLKDETMAYRLAAERLDHAWNNFPDLDPETRLHAALSSYNQGESRTRARGLRMKYVREVLGDRL